MYEREWLKCQDNIPSYLYVPQELWPNKNNKGEQNFQDVQIPQILKYVMNLL